MIRKKSEFSKKNFQGPPENEGLSKRTFLKVVAIASLGMAPFLDTCGISSNPGMTLETAKQKQPEDPGKSDSVSRIARPPIDLAAPARTETAIFALG